MAALAVQYPLPEVHDTASKVSSLINSYAQRDLKLLTSLKSVVQDSSNSNPSLMSSKPSFSYISSKNIGSCEELSPSLPDICDDVSHDAHFPFAQSTAGVNLTNPQEQQFSASPCKLKQDTKNKAPQLKFNSSPLVITEGIENNQQDQKIDMQDLLTKKLSNPYVVDKSVFQKLSVKHWSGSCRSILKPRGSSPELKPSQCSNQISGVGRSDSPTASSKKVTFSRNLVVLHYQSTGHRS